jgi:hypothetical protein
LHQSNDLKSSLWSNVWRPTPQQHPTIGPDRPRLFSVAGCLVSGIDDVDEVTLGVRPTMSHVTARLEMQNLLGATCWASCDQAQGSPLIAQWAD